MGEKSVVPLAGSSPVRMREDPLRGFCTVFLVLEDGLRGRSELSWGSVVSCLNYLRFDGSCPLSYIRAASPVYLFLLYSRRTLLDRSS